MLFTSNCALLNSGRGHFVVIGKGVKSLEKIYKKEATESTAFEGQDKSTVSGGRGPWLSIIAACRKKYEIQFSYTSTKVK